MVEITQADRDAAAEMWTMLGKVQFVHWQADWMRDGTADHGPVVQAFARHRIAGQSASCDLGVGCDEAGVCYAKANGKPEMCHRTTSLATIAALEQPTPELVEDTAKGIEGPRYAVPDNSPHTLEELREVRWKMLSPQEQATRREEAKAALAAAAKHLKGEG